MVYTDSDFKINNVREEYVEIKKKINRALNTYNHNCGQKKSTYIRYQLRRIGCPVPGCRLCGKTPKSKFKSKGQVKKRRSELKFVLDSIDYD